MPFLYNVHTPNKTFALAFKDGEQHEALINRIAKKASLSSDDAGALKGGKDGSGLVYEYEGGRWSLDDDDDLNIMHDRLPPSSTSSATLHLTPPHAHAHFAPPSYSSGALKNKSTKSGPNGVSGGKGTAASTAANTANNASSSLAQNVKEKEKEADKAKAHKGANGTSPTTMSVPTAPPISTSSTAASHHFPQASHSGNTQGPELSALSKKVPGEKVQVVGHTEGAGTGHSHRARLPMLAPPTEGGVGGGAGGRSVSGGRAPSVMSTMSRKSRYGINDAEPLWETKKRAWLEFHNGTGVRTVMGKVGQIDNVRMLLKPGYKGVYVSRSFAIKAHLVDKKYAMGASGYTGLRTLGQVPITVAGRTSSHPAMISEEAHFDVVLGRSWIERMNVKIDPNDQTILTYMDSGESIPCDIVVLKDDKGNKIHIT